MVREPWFSQPMVTLIGKNLSLVSTTLYFDTKSTGDWFADSKEADSKEGHHTQEGAVGETGASWLNFYTPVPHRPVFDEINCFFVSN
jgi:hypothetical protein